MIFTYKYILLEKLNIHKIVKLAYSSMSVTKKTKRSRNTRWMSIMFANCVHKNCSPFIINYKRQLILPNTCQNKIFLIPGLVFITTNDVNSENEGYMVSPWSSHDDVIKWKHFPRYWPFVPGIHRSRWIPHTKASDAELWCLLWSVPE